MSDPRQILINLIAGLDLCDHLGDVSDDKYEALKQMGIEVPKYVDTGDDDDMSLGEWLAESFGATTLRGTSLKRDDGAVE